MYDIKYVDGKPVKVEIDEVEELKNELHKDNEPENAFDVEKRALYANTPKAKAKMDRSLTARSLSEASSKLKSLLGIANEQTDTQYHDELNPKLWDNMELKQEVEDKLKEIAKAFIEYLDINEDAIKDIVITGSSSGYNYTPYSDLDLHLVVDYDKVHKDCPIVEGFLWSMKSQFNKDHDISIYGIPVELYAERAGQGTVHNGLYSLQQNRWLDRPKKIVPPDNDAAVQAKYEELKEAADKIEDSEVAKELLNKIYEMRKAGLADAGELSTENLAFKKLRNDGTIERLKQMEKEQIDKELSLENKLESLLNRAYEDNLIRNKKSGKIYYVKRINPKLHEVILNDKEHFSDVTQHSLDKVHLDNNNEPKLGKHSIDYEYDDEDELVAEDTVEKALRIKIISLSNSIKKLYDSIKRKSKELDKINDKLYSFSHDDFDLAEKRDTLENEIESNKLSLNTMIKNKKEYQRQLQEYYN